MKKILLFTAFLGCFAWGYAQTKNVAVETAGTLSTLLTADETATLTDLTVTGSINKADLNTLNGMPALATLNLSGANIVASSDGETSYAENTIPSETFMGNKALVSVLFPASLQYIGTEAFADCINIKAIDLSACPELVTVGYRAFGGIDGLESLSFNGCSKLTTIDEYAFSNDFYIATIDFRKISEETISLLERANKTLNDPRLDNLLNDAETILKKASETVETLNGTLTPEKLDLTLAELDKTIRSIRLLSDGLEKTLATSKIPQTTASIRELSDSFSTGDSSIKMTILKLNEALDAMTDLIQYINDNPSSVLHGKGRAKQ